MSEHYYLAGLKDIDSGGGAVAPGSFQELEQTCRFYAMAVLGSTLARVMHAPQTSSDEELNELNDAGARVRFNAIAIMIFYGMVGRKTHD